MAKQQALTALAAFSESRLRELLEWDARDNDDWMDDFIIEIQDGVHDTRLKELSEVVANRAAKAKVPLAAVPVVATRGVSASQAFMVGNVVIMKIAPDQPGANSRWNGLVGVIEKVNPINLKLRCLAQGHGPGKSLVGKRVSVPRPYSKIIAPSEAAWREKKPILGEDHDRQSWPEADKDLKAMTELGERLVGDLVDAVIKEEAVIETDLAKNHARVKKVVPKTKVPITLRQKGAVPKSKAPVKKVAVHSTNKRK